MVYSHGSVEIRKWCVGNKDQRLAPVNSLLNSKARRRELVPGGIQKVYSLKRRLLAAPTPRWQIIEWLSGNAGYDWILTFSQKRWTNRGLAKIVRSSFPLSTACQSSTLRNHKIFSAPKWCGNVPINWLNLPRLDYVIRVRSQSNKHTKQPCKNYPPAWGWLRAS